MDSPPKNAFIIPAITSIFVFISIFLFQTCRNVRQITLIVTTGYPLTNGYGYLVAGSGEHWLLKRPIVNNRTIREGDYIDLGYHLNRLYFDDRYVVGEVTKKPIYPENPGRTYSYFIIDTETHNYLLELSKSEFEAELKRLEIREAIELSSRDDSNWLKKKKL